MAECGPEQIVLAESGGYAYGVVGADMHVFVHGGPVYLLHEHRVTAIDGRDEGALPRPSRMLDARSRVVAFTGREEELTELFAWRDADGPRVSALWLYGPGGQGKTRLATEFADRSLADGWKVVTVSHGSGAVPPEHGSQDLRLHGAPGLVLLVDYADRWPLSHLNWFLNNSLLREPVPTRLLLVARSNTMWSPVRHNLERAFQAETSALGLRALESHRLRRQRMFVAARDSFARGYGLAEPSVVEPPHYLDRPEYGLVLALHMAALVAVDAHVHGVRLPEDMVGLSSYLLDRERDHWTRLYENGIAGLDFITPPGTMHRVVFTAVLTGSLPTRAGGAVLRRIELPDAHRALADHRVCYPPLSARTVLEPPYPDRFAEDLLAVALPGHAVTDQPAAPWAEDTLDLVTGVTDDGPAPPHSARAMPFLVAAAARDRWPHVVEHVEHLLRQDPGLAIAGGGDCLAGLAGIDVSLEVLEAVEARLPDQRRIDLDVGIAELGKRLARDRLRGTDDPAMRASEHRLLGQRLARAGRHEESLVVMERSVDLYRALVARAPGGHAPDLAGCLTLLGREHVELGHWDEGLRCSEEAVRLYRELPEGERQTHAFDLARALGQVADLVVVDRHWADALTSWEEAVRLLRGLPEQQLSTTSAELARALAGQAGIHEALGRWEDATTVLDEAAVIYAELAEREPGVHEPELAIVLNSRASVLVRLRRAREGLPLFEEAARMTRSLAETNPGAFSADLAAILSNLSTVLHNIGECARAAEIAAETVERYRTLVAARPTQYQSALADALAHYARCLAHEHRWWEAVRVKREARQRFWDAGLEGVISPAKMMSEKAAEQVRKADALRLQRPTWSFDDHWVNLLNQEEVWRDRYNRAHRIEEMEASYCSNVIGFVMSQADGVVETLMMTNSDEPTDWHQSDTPEKWLARRPLLWALARRARQG